MTEKLVHQGAVMSHLLRQNAFRDPPSLCSAMTTTCTTHSPSFCAMAFLHCCIPELRHIFDKSACIIWATEFIFLRLILSVL